MISNTMENMYEHLQRIPDVRLAAEMLLTTPGRKLPKDIHARRHTKSYP